MSAARDQSIDDPHRRQGTRSIKAKSRGLAGSKRSQAGRGPTERREAKFFCAQEADSFASAVEILARTTELLFHLQLDKHCQIHVVVDPTVGLQMPRSSVPES
jgi:hypothetical protein